MEKFWKYKLDHVLFWVITVGFHIYTRIYLIETAGWNVFLGEIIIRNGLLAAVIYVHLEYLLPVLVRERRMAIYFTGLLMCIAGYVLLKSMHDGFINLYPKAPVHSFWPQVFYNGSILVFYLAFSLALHLSKEWFFQREKLRKMEIEQLNAELQYLKLQINPHFFFNSLNTIYFQIDKTNAAARDTLLKFADLLRYPLYECNGREVPLEKEITYLKNFISLHKLRQDENYDVQFSADIQDYQKNIAPLLLIPFVENAFKHISHFSGKPNEIHIMLEQSQSNLFMRVYNTREKTIKTEQKGGIGLKNVKRRLDLQYSSTYSLEIKDQEQSFEVVLKIPLHEAQLPDH